MNAYELADQVEMWGEDLLALNMKGGIPVVQGAKMLRQQADRIAELEKKTKPLSDEEICQLWKASQEDGIGMSLGYTTQEHYFARAIEERHGIK